MTKLRLLRQLLSISIDLKSPWKSLWVGPLLVCWYLEYMDRWYPVRIEITHGWYWEYMIEDLEAVTE